MLSLSQAFAINVCAYSVMSNHSHLVLHVDVERGMNWTMEEVLLQWHMAFKGTALTRAYLSGKNLTQAQLKTVANTARVYQARLMSISWFMRALNEGIARKANKEEGCTGRFWEGRFKSQALLDEVAVIACMVYVDLNPVRAGMARALKTSSYTSIRRRLQHALQDRQAPHLMPLHEQSDNGKSVLNISLKNYLELVESTCRNILSKEEKAEEKSPLVYLKERNVNVRDWFQITTKFGALFKGAVGSESSLWEFYNYIGAKRKRNIENCRRHFG
jgi:REP element-mobilizing transposase RayT